MRATIFALVGLTFAARAYAIFSPMPVDSVDCCHCDDRYNDVSRITWYSPLTCEKQPVASTTCRRVRVLGRSCESTRWVRGPEGLKCKEVALQIIDGNGRAHPLELKGLSTCEVGLALKASRPRSGDTDDNAAPGRRSSGPSGPTVAGNGAGTETFCSCDKDPRDANRCAFFRTDRGHAAIIDSKPLPDGQLHCDRPACSELFLAEHGAKCPAYYQGSPTLTASND